MVAELSQEVEDAQPVRLRILPDMYPAPAGFVRWFDGTLYRQGWRDEDVAPSELCTERCYVMRYLAPGSEHVDGDSHPTMHACLRHDAASHELGAREVLLREIEERAEAARTKRFETPSLVVDHAIHEVRVDGRTVGLSPHEYTIMRILTGSYGVVVDTDHVAGLIWGAESLVDDKARPRNRERPGLRNVRMVVSRLRQKLDADTNRFIRTVNGRGYILEDPAGGPIDG